MKPLIADGQLIQRTHSFAGSTDAGWRSRIPAHQQVDALAPALRFESEPHGEVAGETAGVGDEFVVEQGRVQRREGIRCPMIRETRQVALTSLAFAGREISQRRQSRLPPAFSG